MVTGTAPRNQERDGRRRCLLCDRAMLRASFYDPEGTIALQGGIHDETDWWVCINPSCPDGRENTRRPSPRGLT